MPVAKIETSNKKMTSLVLTILVLSTGLISAAVLILLNRNQAPKTPASTLSCPLTGAFCEWKDSQEGVSYEYKVIDKTTGEGKMSGRINGKRIDFDFRPEVEHIYLCTVVVVNVCGKAEKSAPVTCHSQEVTPTATPIVTVTMTPQPSPSITPGGPTLTATPIATPSGKLSGTATPAGQSPLGGATLKAGTGGEGITSTPTPTKSASSSATIVPTATPILIVQATNTPGPSPTTAPTSVSSSSSGSSSSSAQQSSSLPQAGNWIPSLAMLSLAIGVIAVGLLL